jgi:class 3 adenylate cyclase
MRMGEDNPSKEPEKVDVDKIIEERERLDKLFKEKFTRVITVMFTDLKGSTSIAETQGDFASRTLIKQHNDILFPIIKNHSGTLVKTMGDGTMSYFERPQDALRSAVEIQKGMDGYNIEKKPKVPILIRIGIHTGTGIVEQNDIFGDVVNVASRFEGQANPGEICLSEDTYNALDDKSEVYCRFVKETTLKGKKDPVKLYKAFWNPKEIEKDMSAPKPAAAGEAEKKGIPLLVKLILFVLIPFLIIFFMIKGKDIFGPESSDEKRSKRHSVTVPAEPSK